MSALNFTVAGLPAPQGSKRGFVNKHTGRVAMVEVSKKVQPWRQDVKHAALNMIETYQASGDPWVMATGPVTVHVVFELPRPKHHYRTGQNAHLLRDNAPKRPSSRPDVDKLLRSTLDALGEAGVWRDDSQVVDVRGTKFYADGHPPGAIVTVVAP